MKYVFGAFLFLLPFHALFITTLECKYNFDADILRFWKEIFIAIFLIFTFIVVSYKNEFSLKKIYANNTLLGVTTAFILSSFVFIFFPYLAIKPSSLLGFKYDVFFLFALIIGAYTYKIRHNIDFLVKCIFAATSIILIVFLPWYLFGNISNMTEYFGYSDKVSTYTAGQCLTFSQNVDGHHRFQATFGGPIRFSVYLVIVYLLYIGYILGKTFKHHNTKYLLVGIPSLFILTSIFFSYSKTSFLGLIFGILLFAWLANKFIFHKGIKKKYIQVGSGIFIAVFSIIVFIKRDLFLHIGSMVNRLENLSHSIEMFFYNPIGYGLGIAGPASQIGRSIESAGGWAISTSGPTNVSKFLPENWYIQILLEQGIIGLSLFIGVLTLIGFYLFEIIRIKKDFFSIGIFTAYMSLLFMGLFTHSFEESATSYTLFLLIGGYISVNLKNKIKH